MFRTDYKSRPIYSTLLLILLLILLLLLLLLFLLFINHDLVLLSRLYIAKVWVKYYIMKFDIEYVGALVPVTALAFQYTMQSIKDPASKWYCLCFKCIPQ